MLSEYEKSLAVFFHAEPRTLLKACIGAQCNRLGRDQGKGVLLSFLGTLRSRLEAGVLLFLFVLRQGIIVSSWSGAQTYLLNTKLKRDLVRSIPASGLTQVLK